MKPLLTLPPAMAATAARLFGTKSTRSSAAPTGAMAGAAGRGLAGADPNLNTLVDFRYARRHEAKRGGHGMGSDMFGAAGADITLKMPVGTIITDAATGQPLYHFLLPRHASTIIPGAAPAQPLFELLLRGEVITLPRGGDGGFGNMRFKSAINRAPRHKTPGWPGEKKSLKLELKVLAD